MNKLDCVAFDPGFGNTKVCLKLNPQSDQPIISSMPACVSRPVSVGIATTGLRATAQSMSVEFKSNKFMIGAHAHLWGRTFSCRDYSLIGSIESQAQFFAGFADCCKLGGRYEVKLLTVGLPVDLMIRATEVNQVTEQLKMFKGINKFHVNGEEYTLDIGAIRVFAQPVGAYFSWLLDDQNHIMPGRSKGDVAVIDVGCNTIDNYMLRDGKPVPAYISGSKTGVRRLIDRAMPRGYDLNEFESDLRSGTAKIDQLHLDSWMTEVLGEIEQTWTNFSYMKAVIPTGGGVRILGKKFTDVLAARGAGIYMPDDPVSANVLGLYKGGCRVLNS